MKKLWELEPNFYHVIDNETNKIVAIIMGRPFEGVWVATEPRTGKILATDSRKADLFRKLGVS